MVLKERQKSILNAVIREYIKTARPVASRELTREFSFGVSPATIRSEMLVLDESGYLEQPHTSAGRIPTDQGYRFFVDHLTPGVDLAEDEETALEKIFSFDAEDEFVKEMSKRTARLSGVFVATGLWDEDAFYESGFSEVLDEPEFREPTYLLDFGRMVDLFDEKVRQICKRKRSQEQFFIGSENPLREGQGYSMSVTSWEHPSGFSGFLAMVGPKRTNYEKHKAIMRYIHSYDE